MTTNATAGFKVNLYVGNGDLATRTNWTKIAQIVDKDGPSVMFDSIESTSSDDEYKSFIYGQGELGEVTFTLRWDPNIPTHGLGVGSLRKYQSDRAVTAFRVKMPGQPEENTDFDAIIQEISRTYSMTDTVTADVTLRPTGPPSYS